jgi:hypothetical protein
MTLLFLTLAIISALVIGWGFFLLAAYNPAAKWRPPPPTREEYASTEEWVKAMRDYLA